MLNKHMHSLPQKTEMVVSLLSAFWSTGKSSYGGYSASSGKGSITPMPYWMCDGEKVTIAEFCAYAQLDAIVQRDLLMSAAPGKEIVVHMKDIDDPSSVICEVTFNGSSRSGAISYGVWGSASYNPLIHGVSIGAPDCSLTFTPPPDGYL